MDIWMMVSKDKYELPQLVADSAGELAEMVGKPKIQIQSEVSHWEHGRLKRSRFVRVRLEDGDTI